MLEAFFILLWQFLLNPPICAVFLPLLKALLHFGRAFLALADVLLAGQVTNNVMGLARRCPNSQASARVVAGADAAEAPQGRPYLGFTGVPPR